MSKQDMGPLGSVDLLTNKELHDTMGHHLDHYLLEKYRGIDYMGLAGPGNGTNTITLPGPDMGYAWSYKLISAQLAGAGVLSAYPSDNTNVAPVGVATAVVNGANTDAVIQFSTNAFVLKDGRNITLLATQVIQNWRIMVEQVPVEMQGKL
jgi:hypothetical protein